MPVDSGTWYAPGQPMQTHVDTAQDNTVRESSASGLGCKWKFSGLAVRSTPLLFAQHVNTLFFEEHDQLRTSQDNWRRRGSISPRAPHLSRPCAAEKL